MKTLCLRFDIDTIGDCEALSYVISTLRRYEARATFFVATGHDRAGLNISHYFWRPWRLLERRVGRRYGLRNLVTSVIAPQRIEGLVDFKKIRRAGNEVSLHGYEHTLWIRDFEKMGREDIHGRIKLGLEAFKKSAGFKPKGFASPGFKSSDNLFQVLEEFEFEYSSDCMGENPFHPVVDGVRLRTPQVPVEIDVEGTVESRGLEGYLRQLEKFKGNTVAYMHPSYHRLNSMVLERTLERAKGSFATLGEVAGEI
jgi:undecaprenyl phosphate-alpha-L-ara4FN deformylase